MRTGSIKLVIHPSGSDNESLTVADAMQQVLDYFKLLDKAVTANGSKSASIVWQLLSASTHSPFTIEATAVSAIPGKSVEAEAIASASLLAEGLNQILYEHHPPDWMDTEAQLILHALLKRSQNGIRQTDFYLPDSNEPVLIETASAQRAIEALQPELSINPFRETDFTHSELGSVEGRVVGLRSYYNKPAIVLYSLLDKREIPCVLVDPEIRDVICGRRNWSQVYESRRVLIPGICFFDRSGKLIKVEVKGEIIDIDPIPVNLSELHDPEFSEGLSPHDHLKRLWAENR
jgi:hypothetical protein